VIGKLWVKQSHCSNGVNKIFHDRWMLLGQHCRRVPLNDDRRLPPLNPAPNTVDNTLNYILLFYIFYNCINYLKEPENLFVRSIVIRRFWIRIKVDYKSDPCQEHHDLFPDPFWTYSMTHHDSVNHFQKNFIRIYLYRQKITTHNLWEMVNIGAYWYVMSEVVL